MKTLLTVVVPVYNGSRYLDNLFDCFERQTVKDFEAVFVDDGSTDGSFEKIISLGEKASFPVKVIKNRGKGVSAARNAGIPEGDGRYLSFIDVDDRITENYVEYLLKESGKHDFDVLFFGSERVSERGPFPENGKMKKSKSISGEYMLYKLAYNPTAFGVYNMFLKRTFRDGGKRFREGFPYYEDYDFLFRVAAEAGRIRYTEERLYFYLLQDGSAVATFSPERVRCIGLLEELVPYFGKLYPDFSRYYETLFLPRIYWSLMWQASLAFGIGNALRFGKGMCMKGKMKLLKKHRDPKIRITAKLYLASPVSFILLSRLLGRRKSMIGKTDYKPFSELICN